MRSKASSAHVKKSTTLLPDQGNGFVFATTGAKYTVLARKAARSLRAVTPDAAIDLFTDQPLEDDVFDQIHPITPDFFRPKIEAMQRSRFHKTICLDADVIVCAPLDDVFAILDRYEMAAAPGVNRSPVMGFADSDIPRSFGVINTGVVAFRKCDAVQALLAAWSTEMAKGKASVDQKSFREVLYQSDVRFWSLPYEYNLMHLPFLRGYIPLMGAPRILHVANLHNRQVGDPTVPYNLTNAIGAYPAALVEWMKQADWSLGGSPKTPRPSEPVSAMSVNMLKRLKHRLHKN